MQPVLFIQVKPKSPMLANARSVRLLGLVCMLTCSCGGATGVAEADGRFAKLEAERKEVRSTADWRKLAQACEEFRARYAEHARIGRVLRIEHGALCQVIASSPPASDPVHARLADVEPELLKRLDGEPEQQIAVRRIRLDLTPPHAPLSSPQGRAKRLENARQLASEFPGRPEPYRMLLELAEGSAPEFRTAMATRLVQGAGTPEAIKQKARALLEKPDDVRRQQLAAQVEAARERLVQQPRDPGAYQQALALARLCEPADGLALARELTAIKRAPPGMHEQAAALVRQLEHVGRPLKLRRRTTTGEVFDLDELRGKIVVIDFWAVWCKPCIAEMPALIDLYQRKKDAGLVVLGYSLDNDEAAPKRFAQINKLPWAVCCDGNGFRDGFASDHGIVTIPTLWIIDKQGVLRDISGRTHLEEKVERYLAE